MFKDYRYINAGTNEYYRWGWKAQEKLASCLKPNENGFYTIPADGGKYWTFGTSDGKFGEYAKYKDTYFSVNSYGFIWCKVGSAKEEAFKEMINDLIKQMKNKLNEVVEEDEEEEN